MTWATSHGGREKRRCVGPNIPKVAAMNIATWLVTWFKGRLVGTDAVGNRYFIEREPHARGIRPRRWVLYPGAANAASVPDGWQAWLRHGNTVALTDSKP